MSSTHNWGISRDARKLGNLIDRVHRELLDGDMAKITSPYHARRSEGGTGVSPVSKVKHGRDAHATYADVAGFCKSATTADIALHGHTRTPGRNVGAEKVEDDGEPAERLELIPEGQQHVLELDDGKQRFVQVVITEVKTKKPHFFLRILRKKRGFLLRGSGGS